MSINKLKSSNLLKIESKNAEKKDLNNDTVKKNPNVKIVRKKTDVQIEKSLTGTFSQKEGEKTVKRKIFKKVQEVVNTGSTDSPNGGNGSNGNTTTINNTDEVTSAEIRQGERKENVARKTVVKLGIRKGGKTIDFTNEDLNNDYEAVNEKQSSKEKLMCGYNDGDYNQHNNGENEKEDINIHKQVVKNKKSTKEQMNRTNISTNNTNERIDRSNKAEEDSENELLNSIMGKVVESTPLIGSQKGVIKKKKKIIIRKKIPIHEKSQNSEKCNSPSGTINTTGVGGRRTPQIVSITGTNVETNNDEVSEGKNKAKGNVCCEHMINEIERNKTKFQEMKQAHETHMYNIEEENKREKDKLNMYIQNLNEEMYSINSKLNEEMKEKDKINESNENLRNAKLDLEQKIEILKNRVEESNEFTGLMNEKFSTLEEENKILLERDQEKELIIKNLEAEKMKLEKKLEEQNILIKKKDEIINKYVTEIENYKNVLKTKGEMMLLGSSTTIDKNLPEKNIQKEYVNKLTKEKKELIYAFKKQLDLIVILKKQINLLENNKIVNITSGELKKTLHD
ncbi:hypothetical protein, conserved [Plasmodium gonderi]|uniref:Uncharacterized protein n=1 Tax=Plasmodium gonderi TaxID=77519 RepID=A0A1Y1J9T3_PLAGO|nr:hypothetical protein, conserved [Plasmodium gonderi]GAW79261.1 hypothetical protein, conserved [Plasmodium gonderi]